MTFSIRTLTTILILQVVLGVVIFSRTDTLDAFIPNEPLIATPFETISKITIGEKDKDPLVLEQGQHGWQLASFHNFPVEQQKVAALQSSVFEALRSFPSGYTMAAARQFQVDEKAPVRDISTEKKDGTAGPHIFLGTSPAFKKVHARIAGEDNTYTLNFSVSDIPTKPSFWFKRDVLHVPSAGVSSLTLGDITLLRDGTGQWKLSGEIEAGKVLDQSKAEALIKSATSLNYLDVERHIDDKKDALANPTLTVTVKREEGEPITFSLEHQEVEGKDPTILLVRSDMPFVFRASQKEYDTLLNARQSSLLSDSPPKSSDADSQTSTQDPSAPSSTE